MYRWPLRCNPLAAYHPGRPNRPASNSRHPMLAVRTLALENIAPIAGVLVPASATPHIVSLLIMVVTSAAGWAAVYLPIAVDKPRRSRPFIIRHSAPLFFLAPKNIMLPEARGIFHWQGPRRIPRTTGCAKLYAAPLLHPGKLWCRLSCMPISLNEPDAGRKTCTTKCVAGNAIRYAVPYFRAGQPVMPGKVSRIPRAWQFFRAVVFGVR